MHLSWKYPNFHNIKGSIFEHNRCYQNVWFEATLEKSLKAGNLKNDKEADTETLSKLDETLKTENSLVNEIVYDNENYLETKSISNPSDNLQIENPFETQKSNELDQLISKKFEIGKDTENFCEREKDSVNPFDEENDIDMENKNEDSEVLSVKSDIKNKIETNKNENLENKVFLKLLFGEFWNPTIFL